MMFPAAEVTSVSSVFLASPSSDFGKTDTNIHCLTACFDHMMPGCSTLFTAGLTANGPEEDED
jgi:hypothetical protein